MCRLCDDAVGGAMMSKELKIDSDRVRKAAEQCPDAARVLKTLFPDVFAPADDGIIAPNESQIEISITYGDLGPIMQLRGSGTKKYDRRSLYLSNQVNWSIERDPCGDVSVLVARRKS